MFNMFVLLTPPSVADAAVALERISKFLTAEELAEPYKVDLDNKFAINVEGSFQWETAYKGSTGGAKFQTGKGKGKHGAKSGAKGPKQKDFRKEDAKAGRKRRLFRKGKEEPILPVTAPKKEGEKAAEKDEGEDKPFELADLKLQIPKGSFIAIVGRVGSGKVCSPFT